MSLKSNKIDNMCYFALLGVFAYVILSSCNHGQTNLEKEIRGHIANVTGLFNSVLMYFISPLCFFPILSNPISIYLSYPMHQNMRIQYILFNHYLHLSYARGLMLKSCGVFLFVQLNRLAHWQEVYKMG